MGTKIGIDLGTTYSCMSYVDDTGVIKIIDNFEGEQITPSVVFFDPDGKGVVGSIAREAGGMNPECLCERVKNYMGDENYRFFVNDKEYSATAVSTLILKKLIGDAEKAVGDIDGVVITCPAYFGEEARAATKMAGENVQLQNGEFLKVLKILDEPTAAAIAYGHSGQSGDGDKTILIYDLGGGTFDCTIMKYFMDNGERKMQVITTGGNHQLGGKDWDAALIDYVAGKFAESNGCDADVMKEDPELKAWFSENIEKAKKNLSARPTTSLTVNYEGNKEKIEITREIFDAETAIYLDQTINLVNDMLAKKGMSMADIDEIVLVGGSTRMPQVTSRLELEYAKPIVSYDPDKAVSIGAAYMAKDIDPNAVENTSMPSAETGEPPVQPTVEEFKEQFAISQQTTGPVIEICTKSYGIRYFDRDKKERVLNLIMKDSTKPAHGRSSDHFPLTITGESAPVNEVSILVMESDSLEETVPREECNEIYLEEPIRLDGDVPGNNGVCIEFFVDQSGILSLTLRDEVTGKEYMMRPTRKSDEANKVGLDEVRNMSLN